MKAFLKKVYPGPAFKGRDESIMIGFEDKILKMMAPNVIHDLGMLNTEITNPFSNYTVDEFIRRSKEFRCKELMDDGHYQLFHRSK